MSDRVRGFCFTINNPISNKSIWLGYLVKNKIKYAVIGDEICPKTGTPHLQGYVEFTNPRTMSGVIKLFKKTAHVEQRYASPQEAADYCKKGGKFVEYGELPEQGKRNDLVGIKNRINEGVKVDDIIQENPMAYHQYGRTLNRLEDLRLRNLYRTWMTTGVWYWGTTGVGKSHLAFEGFTPETHYVYPNDGGWWDGYSGQEIVIFNDYRGELTYSYLLQLLDKWPVTVKRRGREPVPFLAKKVIFTSSMAPEEVYHGVIAKGDDLAQLNRRLEVVKVMPVAAVDDVVDLLGTEVVGGNTISTTTSTSTETVSPIMDLNSVLSRIRHLEV